jgi:hypothetical protein
VLLLVAINATAQVDYRFERSWPAVQQPWYFNTDGITALEDTLFVADDDSGNILKFSREGRFIGSFRPNVTGPAGLDVVAAPDGTLYLSVQTSGNKEIHRVTTDGEEIVRWGRLGTRRGEFNILLDDVTVDAEGFVYSLDNINRIQKFTENGEFVTSWLVTGDNPFPSGIHADGERLLVTVTELDQFGSVTDQSHVKSYTLEGGLLGQFGASRMLGPQDLRTLSDGTILVADFTKNSVVRFNPSGDFLGDFPALELLEIARGGPVVLEVGADDTIYVGEGPLLELYSPDGIYRTAYTSLADTPGRFVIVYSLAVDGPRDRVFVGDFTNRLQVFDGNGRLQQQLDLELTYSDLQTLDDGTLAILFDDGSVGYFDQSYQELRRISLNDRYPIIYKQATAPDGSIYILEGTQNAVFRLDAEGTERQRFSFDIEPVDIDVDPDGFLLVLNDRTFGGDLGMEVTIYGPDDQLVQSWTIQDEFFKSTYNIINSGIVAGQDDNVYIGVGVRNGGSVQNTVLEYSRDGQEIAKVAGFGYANGQVAAPNAIDIDHEGNLYIGEQRTNRVTVMRPVTGSSNSRAIVVAGGGPFQGNNLWDATRINANLGYQALGSQGFRKDEIRYLSADTEIDIDLNGIADDIHAEATNANLQDAIVNWATEADSVVIYLVDHGGEETFRMTGQETLSAAELDGWLDQLQAELSGTLTIVYDACQSGSFVSRLADENRTIITSTAANESAYFVSQGSLSFSNQFWTHVFNGERIQDAYTLAQASTTSTFPDQNPQLDANGNGVANEQSDLDALGNTVIGLGTGDLGSRPQIDQLIVPENIVDTSTARLIATGVSDQDGIGRVYAVIRSPGFEPPAPNTPITELPQVDLQPVSSGRYEVNYDRFNEEGTYQLTVYATDALGNVSVPKLGQITVGDPLKRRAVIVAAGDTADPLWPAIEVNAELAYRSLKQQGYNDDDIEYLSGSTTVGVDRLVSPGNISFAITDFLADQTQDATLFLVGDSNPDGLRPRPTCPVR